jgi:hypothetical protein
MSALPRVTTVKPLGGHTLRLTFTDGLVRDLDLEAVVGRGGVLDPLRDPGYFAQVHVDEATGTIRWPNGVDLDPDVLHGDAESASGAPYRVIRERRLRRTG